jgi:sulfate-transporting ATPase
LKVTPRKSCGSLFAIPHPFARRRAARNLAGAFIFMGNEQDKPTGDLSGGERGRLVLALLIVSARNLLILDESTNHLDFPSAGRFEELLLQFGGKADGKADGKGGYGGVLLLLSQDRALLPDVCDTIVILDGEGNTRVFDGIYCECEARQKMERSEAVQHVKTPDGRSVQVPSKQGLDQQSSQQSKHLSQPLRRAL